MTISILFYKMIFLAEISKTKGKKTNKNQKQISKNQKERIEITVLVSNLKFEFF